MPEYRSDYLTAATFTGHSPSDDFTDLVHEANDSRIHAAFLSGNSRAIFNGAVQARWGSSMPLHLVCLKRAIQQAADIDSWTIVEDGEINLATTLELIRQECLESAAFCGQEASDSLSSALKDTNEMLITGVLNGIKSSGDPAFVPLVQQFKADLEHRAFDADLIPVFYDLANEALAACHEVQAL